MAGYWLGPTTPEPVIPHFFYQEDIDGYEAFSKRILELEKANEDNHQILVLFTARSTRKTTDNEDENNMNSRGWDPDCNLFESVVEFLTIKREPRGWLLKVGIGTAFEWKDERKPFKTDPRLKITSVPTLLAWNTMKRISGFQAFQVENILVMLED